MTELIAIVGPDTSSDQPTICQRDEVASTRPTKMRIRGSTLPLSRPTRNIATKVPMPRAPSR